MDMAISTEWKSKKLIYIRYYDRVSGSDVIRHAVEATADPRFDNLRFGLSDWRDLGEFDFDIQDVEELAAYTSAFTKTNPNIMHAIVMSQQETPQAFAGMYKFLADKLPWKTELFHTMEDAMSWLESASHYTEKNSTEKNSTENNSTESFGTEGNEAENSGTGTS